MNGYPQCFENLPGTEILCSWWWVRDRKVHIQRAVPGPCCGKWREFPCPTQGEKPVVEEF